MASASPTYFHGTWAGYGHAIMTRGIELGHEGRGNLLGRGVYIAPTLAAAALWTPSEFIITCALVPGSRILWIEESYNSRVIRTLEREFGRELTALGPHFARAIPHNKQLTPTELIHLCGYVIHRMRRGRDQNIFRGEFREAEKLIWMIVDAFAQAYQQLDDWIIDYNEDPLYLAQVDLDAKLAEVILSEDFENNLEQKRRWETEINKRSRSNLHFDLSQTALDHGCRRFIKLRTRSQMVRNGQRYLFDA